jgi:NADPH:quinone reductase-like Zn-dependent oxidoreductase
MEMPKPKAGEIRIEVAYAGINFADLLMRLGLYQPRPKYPFTPGYELSGVVDAVGDGVTDFSIGQRVVAALPNGGQASHVIVNSQRALHLPDEVGLDVAASIPVTYLTAHHMLHHLGHMTQNDAVLIHGGAGGVGTAALQICQWAGVSNVWATASGHKSSTIEAFGGTAIDRHNEDFVEVIKKPPTTREWTIFLIQLEAITSAVHSQFSKKEGGFTPTVCQQQHQHQRETSFVRTWHGERRQNSTPFG